MWMYAIAEQGSNSEGDSAAHEIVFEELFPLADGKYEGETLHSFKGAMWRMLVMVQGVHIGVYAVVANMKDLPIDWEAAVQFSFMLVHPKDEGLNLLGPKDKFTFKWCVIQNEHTTIMACCLNVLGSQQQ